MLKHIKKSIGLLLVFLLLLSLVGCVSHPQGGKPSSNPPPSPSHNVSSSPQIAPSLGKLSDQLVEVVKKVKPAVVYIQVKKIEKGFFTRQEVRGSGSGVILHSDGYILTNNHVVEGAEEIEVSLPGANKRYQAELVGTDPLTDLAVIKIEDHNLPTAHFGDVSELHPGNLVIAVGNPLGLQGGPTITLGVVSSLGRSFRVGESTYYDVIQTDAAINPGNSGGPLVNMKGKVVGINSVMARGAENIGFAISANTAKPVFKTLIKPPHKVKRAWLGVVLQTVNPKLAAKRGLSRTRGALIFRVAEDSPAGRAGLKKGDIIIRFEGEEIKGATELIKAIWKCEVGEKVKIKIVRNGAEKEMWVELGKRPPGI